MLQRRRLRREGRGRARRHTRDRQAVGVAAARASMCSRTDGGSRRSARVPRRAATLAQSVNTTKSRFFSRISTARNSRSSLAGDGGLNEKPVRTDIVLVTPVRPHQRGIVAPKGKAGAPLALGRCSTRTAGTFGSVEYRSVERVTIEFTKEAPHWRRRRRRSSATCPAAWNRRRQRLWTWCSRCRR